ncbi:MAG: fructosamine kinase family protein [Chromatiales bacterium]|nr:MAG: fructosamine kinase family protein [Chromatiales bacterium]
MIPAAVAAALAPVTGELAASTGAGGGSINDSYVITGTGGRRWFLKLNDAGQADMFAAEAAGLEEMAAADAVRVPHALAHGTAGHHAYLLLECLDLGRGGAAAAAQLGRQLAAQHRVVREQFGWRRDNTIGSTPQPNGWCEDWVEFWRERRLGFQLDLARDNGYDRGLLARGRELLARLPELLAGHRPEPSLLHGDLWAGNWGVLTTGEPVIFDPAVYFGDREADLAMTRLFGGFPPDFYTAYDAAWSLPPGHEQRVALYNLYHVLNHLNLFGQSYAAQAQGLMDRLLASGA